MNTSFVPSLLETLAAELERSRELPAQVLKHVTGTYGIDRDAIGPFLVNELPKLEDYEIDLILSPVFTPALPDQAVFAELLGRDSVPVDQWPALIQQLVVRPTCAQLLTGDRQTQSVALREVSIERYVHRLCLEATISEPLFNLINHLPPAADRPMLKAIARRAIWDGARGGILTRYLMSAAGGDAYRLDDAIGLLRLAEAYEPTDIPDLLARIPRWQQVLQQEINVAGSPKAFFNERVEELHGGGRDQRRQDNTRITAKENESALLGRLLRALAG
jgi:hypothetical protein